MGSEAVAREKLPFDAGFEAVGVVAAVGPSVSGACLSPLCSLHALPYLYLSA